MSAVTPKAEAFPTMRLEGHYDDLARLPPDLINAAVEGRLPRGKGVARLCDLPAKWFRQHQMLGFTHRVNRVEWRGPLPAGLLYRVDKPNKL